MIHSIYLHRDDLKDILQFMSNFPDAEIVEVTADKSSGIGQIVEANLHHVDLNGLTVKICKTIVDETSW